MKATVAIVFFVAKLIFGFNFKEFVLEATVVRFTCHPPGKKRALPLQRPRAGLKRLRRCACRSKKRCLVRDAGEGFLMERQCTLGDFNRD